MRTTYLIQQHQRIIRILEMVQENDRQLNLNINRLEDYKKAGSQAWLKYPFWDKEELNEAIDWKKQVAARLRSYYLKTIESITEKAIL